MSVKNTLGYIKVKKEIDRNFKKHSITNYCSLILDKSMSVKGKRYYCYNYEIANAIADYTERKYRIKKHDIGVNLDKELLKYILFMPNQYLQPITAKSFICKAVKSLIIKRV